MTIKAINIKEVEFVAFRLAKDSPSFNEPIPEFETRFPKKLESCLQIPFQTFSKKLLYKGLVGKAAILFYLLIKNHPFQNGNKRIAITALLFFLEKNGKWIKISTKEFYNFAIWVASSPAELKTDTVEAIESFLKNHLINL